MNIETKIGLFVLMALVVTGVGVLKLSDVQFEKRYILYFVFEDVGNLREKSQVKIAGVEVGRVDEINLEGGRAKITARILNDVPVYANARVRVKLSGIIGTQFLDLRPGTPETARLKDGDTIYGETSSSLDVLVDKFTSLLEGKDGKPGLKDDLSATMANLRSVTNSLNAAIGLQKNELVDMVQNLHQFSADLKGVASDFHEITSTRKQDIEASLTKLREVLERVDAILAKVQSGEGAVGKLISDKQVGEEVKETVSNIKKTSESAKDVLARFVKMRSFWEVQLRAVPGAGETRADGGIRLQPRDKKYYYLGINNAGDGKDEFGEPGDYEKENTITALIGKEFGRATLEMGAIRSRAGIGLKVYPFRSVISDSDTYRWARNIEFNTQSFDFGRDEVRGKAGYERRFKSPQFDIGVKYKIGDWIEVGASLEDIAEIRQYNVNTHLIFEDRDLSYLFGFVSFAR